MHPNTTVWWPLAGVVVALAFFVLVGYLARVLRATRRLPVVIAAIGGLIAALPGVLYALYYVVNATAV
ncbi:hypothetical protein [Streptomyces albireticuli]|uniref:Uncharacterized protein n=1 Tax=Streptomyces albireticuli TaxID=1940 RepID=A0A2A2D9N4_9ACTN|nr:hypothetical protein [Streptomyces albireticuli]MCD9140855.1 hypothetical protein [Streptomyces albireticuli]MCD9161183.1 hypothetical protein [Streptomyces albireticuli]MCD9190759.1 hypothetical protein [Streptomyces albireticuli]PAU48157.1 hypothetical protein CK936_14860 [Streptomyces albireticuli]